MITRFRQLLPLFVLLATTLFGTDLMDLSEVRVGMHGEGVTVLEGEKRITFGVEILGVVDAIAPNYPMIIARLDHPMLKKSGIVAGMSGSPVTIDGKLLGAVAYGWGFSKEPICGITPAVVMHQNHGALPLQPPDTGKILEAFTSRDYASILPLLESSLSAASETNGMSPLPLPLSSGRTGTPLDSLFSSAGLLPSTGGQAVKEDEAHPLQAGDPVAAALVLGPYPLYASGTVTEVEGDRIYVFGHPFLGLGPCDYPMARAHPVTTLSSIYRSSRLANMGGLLGRFSYDGRSGLTGRLGDDPRMIPFTVTATSGEAVTWRLIRHPLFTPLLMAWTLSQGLANHPGRTGRGTWLLSTLFKTTDGRTIAFEESFSGEGVMKRILGAVTVVPLLLTQNPYRSTTLASGSVTLKWNATPAWDRITGFTVMEGTIRGGEEIPIRIRLTNQEGKSKVRTARVSLPHYPDGTNLRLYLVSGETYGTIRQRWIKISPHSYDGLIRLIGDHVPSNHLILLILRSEEGLTIDDIYLPHAGGRLTRILKGKKVPWTIEERDLMTLPHPVRGYKTLTLTLHDHGGQP